MHCVSVEGSQQSYPDRSCCSDYHHHPDIFSFGFHVRSLHFLTSFHNYIAESSSSFRRWTPLPTNKQIILIMAVMVLRKGFYFVVCMLLSGRGEYCGDPCALTPTITPPLAVVQYGSPLSVNCFMCGNSCYGLKWEVPLGSWSEINLTGEGINKTGVQWNVTQTTEWSMAPKCYGNVGDNVCCTSLHVTLYKPPDNVSISFVNHTGPLLEGQQYTLQCHVQEVAPSQNLTVAFYRGDATLGLVQASRKSTKTPVTETFTTNINSSIADNVVKYWCEAKLDLGPQGPQPPPMMRSELLTTTVYFKPQMLVSSLPDPIKITDGETLQLNCTAFSNPSPVYSWIGPDKANLSNDSVLTIHSAGFQHEGQYICVASNNQGSATMKLYVDVSVDFLPIVAGLSVVLVLVIIVIGAYLCASHYRHTKMGDYQLRDVFHLHRGNAEQER